MYCDGCYRGKGTVGSHKQSLLPFCNLPIHLLEVSLLSLSLSLSLSLPHSLSLPPPVCAPCLLTQETLALPRHRDKEVEGPSLPLQISCNCRVIKKDWETFFWKKTEEERKKGRTKRGEPSSWRNDWCEWWHSGSPTVISEGNLMLVPVICVQQRTSGCTQTITASLDPSDKQRLGAN